uniref:Sugar binding protein n=1 Tax=Rhizophora mucronata TaxID=61149 RepID=A0A2P2J7Z8_RHIMU
MHCEDGVQRSERKPKEQRSSFWRKARRGSLRTADRSEMENVDLGIESTGDCLQQFPHCC